MSTSCRSSTITCPRLDFAYCFRQGSQPESRQQKDSRVKLRMLDQKYIFLFLISCEQQHDSKMKNNSVSYFFTQRDRQTDPPTAAAAATTVRPLSEALRQAHTTGVVGPGSEEGISPFFLPCQPMLLLGEGLTWADPSLWFSPVTFYRACSHVW